MFKLVNRLADKHNRLVFTELFHNQPILNASVVAASEGSPSDAERALTFRANRNFELAGTNAANADVTFDANGEMVLTTQNSDGDQMIVQPHSDTLQSRWNVAGLFGSENAPTYELIVRTQASIADVIVWGGLKLTSTSVVATDDDQVFFRYEDSVGANWQLVISRAGVDVSFDTGIAVAVSTKYRLSIHVDEDRKVQAWINDQPINLDKKFDAIVTGKNLKPFYGVETDTTADKALGVLGLECSRVAAA